MRTIYDSQAIYLNFKPFANRTIFLFFFFFEDLITELNYKYANAFSPYD